MADLTGVINLLGGKQVEPMFFVAIVDQLEECKDGGVLMALLAVITAQVTGENGQAVKMRRVRSLIRTCKGSLPHEQRQDVILLLQKDWEKVDSDVRREVVSALIEGPDVWDVSSLVWP